MTWVDDYSQHDVAFDGAIHSNVQSSGGVYLSIPFNVRTMGDVDSDEALLQAVADLIDMVEADDRFRIEVRRTVVDAVTMLRAQPDGSVPPVVTEPEPEPEEVPVPVPTNPNDDPQPVPSPGA